VVFPYNIELTEATYSAALTKSLVPPRNDGNAHPNTIWDQQDINDLKAAMVSNSAYEGGLNFILNTINSRMALSSTTTTFSVWGGAATYPAPYVPQAGDFTTHGVPIPHIVNGVPKFLGDPTGITQANGSTLGYLGIAYAFTGDAKYAEYARQMLLEYAQYYAHYPHPPGWTINSYRSAIDDRLTFQFLNDAGTLIGFGWVVDLIHNYSAFTPAELAYVRTNLLEAVAEEFSDPVLGPIDYLSGGNNRSALAAASVLIAGYASDDPTMINNALYGTGGSAGNPQRGGGLTVAQWGNNIQRDGLWSN
jgi:hypothetical protein